LVRDDRETIPDICYRTVLHDARKLEKSPLFWSVSLLL
jgi:hypothetical protein